VCCSVCFCSAFELQDLSEKEGVWSLLSFSLLELGGELLGQNWFDLDLNHNLEGTHTLGLRRGG